MKHNKNMKDILRLPIVFTDGVRKTETLEEFFCTALYWKFIKPVAKYILKTEKR